MDIITKAKELGAMIAESNEMAVLKDAEVKFQNDEKSMTLFSDYKKLQYEMVQANQQKKEDAVLNDIKTKLINKEDEINTYSVTKDYLQAKSKFDDLVKTVNHVLIHAITGENPCTPDKCSSCGGGCK